MEPEKKPSAFKNPAFTRGLLIVATIAAALSLALGAWDIFVERDGGEDWLMQIVFPILLLFLMIALYQRQKRAT